MFCLGDMSYPCFYACLLDTSLQPWSGPKLPSSGLRIVMNSNSLFSESLMFFCLPCNPCDPRLEHWSSPLMAAHQYNYHHQLISLEFAFCFWISVIQFFWECFVFQIMKWKTLGEEHQNQSLMAAQHRLPHPCYQLFLFYSKVWWRWS